MLSERADTKATYCRRPSDVPEEAVTGVASRWVLSGREEKEGWLARGSTRPLSGETDRVLPLVLVNTQLYAFVNTNRTVHHKE